MKKICAIVIALILVIGLPACAGDAGATAYPEPADKIDEPDLTTVQEETPAPLVEEAELEPEELEEPEEPAPVEEPIYIPVYTPPEVPPATLAEAFAAVVYRVAHLDDETSAYGFSIMDIDLDGEPELLVHRWGINGFSSITPFNMALAQEFIFLTEDDVFDGGGFLMRHSVRGAYPMRFYQNDATGQVIFSTHSVVVGGGAARWVTYANNRTFETHRIVMCFTPDDGSHRHELWYGSDWWNWWRDDAELPITEFDGDEERDQAAWEEWVWAQTGDITFGFCGIQHERGSPSPTLVQLIDMALVGFTEIPAPERHVLEGTDNGRLSVGVHGTYMRFFFDYVGEIQDWIHSIIG